ncbi:hypothetical protein QBC43DRAFT_301815 [Cladorrhinum sp. PSN259]|nr:hypothetical protein QBC43DRAFT_301815 [Cladorrhinum sp. PSN259]
MAHQNPITPARDDDEDSYEFIDIEKEELGDDSDWDILPEDGSQDEDGASRDIDIVESDWSEPKNKPLQAARAGTDDEMKTESDASNSVRAVAPDSKPVVRRFAVELGASKVAPCSDAKDLFAESDAVQAFFEPAAAAAGARCPPSSPVISGSPAHTTSSLPNQVFNLTPAAVFLPVLGPLQSDEESDALLLPVQSSPGSSMATADSNSDSDSETDTDTDTDTNICAAIIATLLNVAVSIVALGKMTVECCFGY